MVSRGISRYLISCGISSYLAVSCDVLRHFPILCSIFRYSTACYSTFSNFVDNVYDILWFLKRRVRLAFRGCIGSCFCRTLCSCSSVATRSCPGSRRPGSPWRGAQRVLRCPSSWPSCRSGVALYGGGVQRVLHPQQRRFGCALRPPLWVISKTSHSIR